MGKEVSDLTTGNKRERDAFLEELKTTKNQDSLRQIKQRDEVDSLRQSVQGYSAISFRDSMNIS